MYFYPCNIQYEVPYLGLPTLNTDVLSVPSSGTAALYLTWLFKARRGLPTRFVASEPSGDHLIFRPIILLMKRVQPITKQHAIALVRRGPVLL